MTGSEWNGDEGIGHHLSELIQRTDALAVLLVNLDGTGMSVKGDSAQIHTGVLAGLVAEMVSCGRAMAGVVGEEGFSTVLQLGEHRHVHLSLIGNSHVLVVVFEDDREAGLVRLQARRTAESLAEVLRTQPAPLTEGDEDATQSLMPRRIDPIERIFGTLKRTESEPHSP